MGSTAETEVVLDPKRDRLVITASSLGTVFEWYDFFVYGILAALIGKLFFPADNPTAATLASLAIFGAGFGVRPFGAILFGYFGDKIGRKHTFLVTITLMGVATAAIGLLPTFETAGIWAAGLLLLMRCLQGLALGGEYGGAAIYVAEHAPDGKRGQYTSWIQASVAGGFLLAVIVVLITRQSMSTEAFEAWGWRVPFLTSILLLAISLYMRLKLSESPVFKAMKAAGTTSKKPVSGKLSISGQCGAYFRGIIRRRCRIDRYLLHVAIWHFILPNRDCARSRDGCAFVYGGGRSVGGTDLCCLRLAVGQMGPQKVALAWLRPFHRRRVSYFLMMADAANPALAQATERNPVTLSIPQCDFNALNRVHESECAQALNFLTKRGIAYSKQASDTVSLNVGDSNLQGFDEKAYITALEKAGYPDKSDPAQREPWKIILAVFLMVALSGMTYGQVAAILVEMFPAKIRYTSMSIPYHIGAGYFGGFLPYISQYIVAQTGQPFSGLWYTVGVTALAFVVALIWLPETSGKTKLD